MRRPSLLASTVLPGQLLDQPMSQLPCHAAPARAQVRYKLGDPGRPSLVPTLLIALCDDSGSVTAPAGTDPLSNRYSELTQAFTAVARRGASHELGAVLHFDSPTAGDVGPVPITRRGLLTLRSGLGVPPDGRGSSELGPGLARAGELAAAHPEHEITLVVLSDFALLDPDPAPVLSDLAAFPGQVHAVVLGSRLPTGVLDDRITITHIHRGDAPGAVARALFASLTTHRR